VLRVGTGDIEHRNRTAGVPAPRLAPFSDRDDGNHETCNGIRPRPAEERVRQQADEQLTIPLEPED